MRVYLPSTVPLLRRFLDVHEIGPAPLTAYAVTPALREWYAEGDTEELEYVATLAAARASLRLLADDPAAPRRRVVVAADVPDPTVHPVPDVERAAVLLLQPLRLSQVVSGHLDDDGAAVVVAAAAGAVRRADAKDEDAEFLVDEADARDLQWYATQELGGVAG